MSAEPRAVPKYYLLKEQLRALVRDATPGALIPTERALAEQYATSRTTVRQAIGELVAEGVLGRAQGRGTFVAPPRFTYVRQLTSFSDDADAQGLVSSSTVLDVSRTAADDDTAARLRMPVGAELARVERIRLINGEPLAHEVALLAGALPGLAAHLDRTGSLYTALRQDYGIDIVAAEDTVETRLAGPDDVRLLGIEMGAPLLLIHRLGFTADDSPVEWTRSVFRGDRFRFLARMKGPQH
ncbi:GntR family transcriptional regulator [Kocuria sp. CPCC 205258]|jgi:GntR family transcriptional regulator|uniref:GntR family transcriptional regulator n=1 Tax=Kocuria sp. CPCC 205258 TaxID=3073552 RepID=UPI0034D44C80